MEYEVIMRKVCSAFFVNYSKYSYSKVATVGERIGGFVISTGRAVSSYKLFTGSPA